MDELRPCPFCGGEAQVVRKPYETKFCVGCGDDACLGFSGLGWLYETEEQAAAAWNRRAERTCRIVRVQPGWWECDACGRSIRWDLDEPPHVHYCPRCGARAVDDDGDR